MEPAIEVRDLARRFGEIEAVRGVSYLHAVSITAAFGAVMLTLAVYAFSRTE